LITTIVCKISINDIGIGWQNLELKDYYTVSKVSLGSLGKQGESGIWANANSEMEITFQRSLSKSKSPSLSLFLLSLARNETFGSIYISLVALVCYLYFRFFRIVFVGRRWLVLLRARASLKYSVCARKERHEIKVV
jgi:hypothetical protein